MNFHNTSKQGIFNPRYTKYTGDGIGRDKYIIFNNGALLDKISKIKIQDNFHTLSNTRYYNLQKNVAPLKYISDGSGRDSYVLFESGGLEKNHKSLKSYHLKDFLRKNNSESILFHTNHLKEWVNPKTLHFTKKENEFFHQKKNLEKELVDRLYYSEAFKFTNQEHIK